jgi:hypothetical protein
MFKTTHHRKIEKRESKESEITRGKLEKTYPNPYLQEF